MQNGALGICARVSGMAMLSQCSAIATLPAGTSGSAHTYAASAVCWNKSAAMASSAMRSRVDRVRRGYRRIERVYRTATTYRVRFFFK